jgi:acetoin utilization protein AcuB
MSPAPHTIAADQMLDEAHRLMRSHRIRHLPVLRQGKLVGIVSQRDLMLIESLPDVDPAEVPVEDAMSSPIYVVGPRAPLAAVATEMADRKLGSAIVVEKGRVVGVFTVTDACRALARMIAPSPSRPRRPSAERRGRV